MSDFWIIKCEANDWFELQKIALKTFRKSYEAKNDPAHFDKYVAKAFSKGQIKIELANPSSHFFFVKNQNELAGYFKINEPGGQSDLNKPKSLEVERIYLFEKFKGQGLGRSMIGFSSAFAKSKGLSELWLGVWEKNPDAVSFYKKMGFEEFGTHVFKIGEDEQRDFLLNFPV